VNIYNPAKRILFVGAGEWPRKVGKTLFEQDLIQEPTYISARKFTDDLRINLEDLDLVWVATTPQLQVNVMKRLEDFTGAVMLEKPLARDINEFDEIESLIRRRAKKIFLSQPWSFNSNSMLDQQMSDLHNVERIEIVRSGNVQREYMDSWLDWAPHDLYMLAKYIPHEFVNLSSYQPPNGSTELLGKLNISLKSGLRISLSAGYSLERRSEWTFEMNNGEFKNINLLSAKQNQLENRLDSIAKLFINCFAEDETSLINQLKWQRLSLIS
jgi:hypothetical protein